MLFALIHHDSPELDFISKQMEFRNVPAFVTCESGSKVAKAHIVRAELSGDEFYDLFDAQDRLLGRARQIDFDYPDYAGQIALPAGRQQILYSVSGCDYIDQDRYEGQAYLDRFVTKSLIVGWQFDEFTTQPIVTDPENVEEWCGVIGPDGQAFFELTPGNNRQPLEFTDIFEWINVRAKGRRKASLLRFRRPAWAVRAEEAGKEARVLIDPKGNMTHILVARENET
jgi:hypothetical protein